MKICDLSTFVWENAIILWLDGVFTFLKKKLIGWYYKTKDFDFDSTFPVQIKHGDDWLENSNIKKKNMRHCIVLLSSEQRYISEIR